MSKDSKSYTEAQADLKQHADARFDHFVGTKHGWDDPSSDGNSDMDMLVRAEALLHDMMNNPHDKTMQKTKAADVTNYMTFLYARA